jgi:anti-sigma factor RsiW
MLSCREVTQRASLVVDGDLPRNEKLAVRFHLLMCAQCRRLVANLRTLTRAVALRGEQKNASPVDEHLAQRIVTAILDHAPPRRPGETPRPPDG